MIDQQISDCVGDITSAPVTMRQGDKAWQNLIGDSQIGERVYLEKPLRAKTPNIMFPNQKDFYITLFFSKKSELQMTPEQHQAALNVCWQMEIDFLSNLPKYFKTFDVIDEQEVWNFYDANVDGIMLMLKVHHVVQRSICPVP